jgi:hypothetical protein
MGDSIVFYWTESRRFMFYGATIEVRRISDFMLCTLQATRQGESASPDNITLCSAKMYGAGLECSSLTKETPFTFTHCDYTGDP